MYADDLNALRAYASNVADHVFFDDLAQTHTELHAWGATNQVTFEAGIESMHVLSRSRPAGDSLVIYDAVHECAVSCGWKLGSLLRSRRFLCVAELVKFSNPSNLSKYVQKCQLVKKSHIFSQFRHWARKTNNSSCREWDSLA